jgi:hypothetical protein
MVLVVRHQHDEKEEQAGTSWGHVHGPEQHRGRGSFRHRPPLLGRLVLDKKLARLRIVLAWRRLPPQIEPDPAGLALLWGCS